MAIYSRRYLRSVADFMSAGRVAGSVPAGGGEGGDAGGRGGVCRVVRADLAIRIHPELVGTDRHPVSLLVALSGFVVYRFRQTRALTLAVFRAALQPQAARLYRHARVRRRHREFRHHSRRGRAGHGVFLGLPATIHVAGWSFDTYIALKALFLGGALFMVLAAG